MASRTISIDLIARNRASGVFNQVGKDAEKAAGQASTAFASSSSKIGRGFAALGTAGASFGVPFASSLGTVGAAVQATEKTSKGFGATLSHIGKVEAIAAGAGLAVAATQLRSFVTEGRESARVGRLTEQVLKSTGGAAGLSAKQVAGLADALSAKAGVDDEVIQSGENVLLTFTQVRDAAGHGNDVFTQGTKAALNLSAALGQDLQSSIIQVGKALNDPIAGMTALKRVGVSFTESQKEQIKALAKSGNLLGAQKIILKELQTEFGGAAAAAADPFDKLAVKIENVKEKIGLALIPQLEKAGEAAFAMGHGFNVANDATNGYLGKTLALGAAIPVAVFATEKLGAAAIAIGGQYTKAINAITGMTAATEAAATAEAALATASTAGAAASTAGTSARAARTAASIAVASAEQAEVAAALEATAADQALIAVQYQLATSSEVDAAALTELAAASTAATAANARLAAASATAAASSGAVGGAAASGAAGMGALATGAATAGFAIGTLGLALGNARLDDRARGMSGLGKAAYSVGRAFIGLLPGSTGITAALGFLAGGHKKNADATKEDTLATLQDTLAKAQNKLATASQAAALDPSAKNLQKVAAARREVQSASKALAGVENIVTGATNQGAAAAARAAGAVAASGAAADGAKFGYFGLASAVNTVAQAFAALDAQNFGPIQAQISADTATAQFQDALTALNAPPESSGGGGGGGGGETATAAALDKQSKELAVRDAERGVESAVRGVKDAETSLTQARKDAKTAAKEVTDAQKNLRVVLDGVAADSLAAQQATEAFTNAQDAARSAALDLGDAQRGLAVAKVSQGLNKFGVIDAQRNLDQARSKLRDDQESGAADPSQISQDLEDITKNEIALQIARIEAGKKDEDVKRAEIALNEQRVTGKQKTRDLNEAQRVLNGTLRGYAPSSREAKEAQNALTEAQNNARDKTQAVVTATLALRDANDQTATAALGLQRAVADMNGQLTSAAGGGGGAAKLASAMDSAKIKLDAVKTAGIAMATSVRDSVYATTHSLAGAIAAEIGVVEGIISKSPQLASAFGPILEQIKQELVAQVSKQAFATGTSIVPGGTGHRILGGSGLASGGAVRGTNPSGIPILAHPGEYVVRQKAVEKYGLKAMERVNAGTAVVSLTVPKKRKHLPEFAAGGPIKGKDPKGIPILAHPGEFVIREKAVQKYGLRTLDLLNKGSLPKFANGGPIGSSRPSTPLTYKAPARTQGETHIHIHLEGDIYGVQSLNETIIKALRDETRRNGSIRGVSVTR